MTAHLHAYFWTQQVQPVHLGSNLGFEVRPSRLFVLIIERIRQRFVRKNGLYGLRGASAHPGVTAGSAAQAYVTSELSTNPYLMCCYFHRMHNQRQIRLRTSRRLT